MNCVILLRVLVALLVVAPLVVSLILSVELYSFSGFVTVGIYALAIFVHFVLQSCYALKNKRDMENASQSWETVTLSSSVGVQLVGYREDPELFERACRALNHVFSENMWITRVVCVVDGNEEEDLKMVAVFHKVFSDKAQHYNFEKLPTFDQVAALQGSVLVISQPHVGKRAVLRTGMWSNMSSRVDYALLLDSDTVVDAEAPRELKHILDRQPEVAAVAGDVRIYNMKNMLSLLWSLKYLMAYYLERGAQSAHGVVACVGGPLGM